MNQLVHPMEQSLSRNPKIPFLYFHSMHQLNALTVHDITVITVWQVCSVHTLHTSCRDMIRIGSRTTVHIWIYTAKTQSFLSNYISYFQYYVFKCVTIWFIHNAYNILKFQTFYLGMWGRSWLGQCTSNRNVAGSIPDGVIWIFKWNIAFGRTMALGLTEPLTEMSKGKAIPLQAWRGPQGSRKLRFLDYMTMAQDGGSVVSLMHRPPLLPRKCSWYPFLLEAESTPGP